MSSAGKKRVRLASYGGCKVITGIQAMGKCSHLLMFTAAWAILLTSVSQKSAKTSNPASDYRSYTTHWTEWISGELLNTKQRVRRKGEEERHGYCFLVYLRCLFIRKPFSFLVSLTCILLYMHMSAGVLYISSFVAVLCVYFLPHLTC